MDFREQVHAEASALVQRLHVDKSESVRVAQQALRQALDAAVEAAEAAITAPIVLDEDIAALSEKIEAAACARVEAATTEVTRDLQVALDTARAESERLAAALEGASGALEDVRQELQGTRQELEGARHELEGAKKDLDGVRQELDEAEDEHNRAQAAAQQSALAPLDLLLEAMRRFANATSAADVFSVLVESLGQDLGRAALFSVEGGRLEGVRQVGIEFATDISTLVVPLGMDSVLSDAVSSGRIQGLLGPGLTARTRALFGGSPRFALVVPVVIKGQAIAVVYADDASGTANDLVRPEQQMKLAELLLCQAVPRLPALLRTEQAVTEHASEIRQLLERVEQGYDADRNGGVSSDGLHAGVARRLAEARGIYQRAAGMSDDVERMFDEQLASLAQARADSPFGQALASVAPHRSHLTSPDVVNAAAARA